MGKKNCAKIIFVITVSHEVILTILSLL